MRFFLPNIRHDYSSFEALARLHAETERYFFDHIEIDMSATDCFDADLCAAFGAILYGLERNLNTVHLVNLRHPVENILSKNGFLSHYGGMEISDRWGTTISYQQFDEKDDRYFVSYIEREFIHRSEIPKMSLGLLKKFGESISEIFNNAVLHSRTQLGIFSCGQSFPEEGRLDFTVADRGVGILENIKQHTELKFSPEEAIIWATQEYNTTKLGSLPDVPGGLGLKLLCDFIDLNGGCIQIVSDGGYWQRKDSEVVTKRLNYAFPGTVVSIEINTADTGAYILAAELNAEEIF